MQRTLRAAAIAMVTTIISPGMSGGNPVQTEPAASAATEACSLLTKEAAAAALGEAVKGPERRSGMSAGDGTTASSCEYTTFFSIEFRGTGNPTEAIKGVAKSVYGRLQ